MFNGTWGKTADKIAQQALDFLTGTVTELLIPTLDGLSDMPAYGLPTNAT